MVEAFTIVLAVALTRSWRPALWGTAAALAILVLLVVIFGPLFALIPLHLLQYVVGSLLILFGMRWLRKAILRTSGLIALRDEAAALTRLAADRRADWLAGMAAFKALHLVGLMALVTAAVRLWGLAPLWGGGLLLAGCIGVMACSLWQRARQ